MAREALRPVARVVGLQERREAAAARIQADRAGIAAVLATHPHPDPAERNGAAREAEEERAARREHSARMVAEASAADAAARAAFTGRGLLTWLRNVALGSLTPEQAGLADLADLTARNVDTRPDDDTLRAARERGRLLALAARDRTAAWEGRKDVAEAMEQARLNALVDRAAAAGDPRVGRAIEAGDPEAARAAIRHREAEEMARQGMEHPGVPAPPGTGGYGKLA